MEDGGGGRQEAWEVQRPPRQQEDSSPASASHLLCGLGTWAPSPGLSFLICKMGLKKDITSGPPKWPGRPCQEQT